MDNPVGEIPDMPRPSEQVVKHTGFFQKGPLLAAGRDDTGEPMPLADGGKGLDEELEPRAALWNVFHGGSPSVK